MSYGILSPAKVGENAVPLTSNINQNSQSQSVQQSPKLTLEAEGFLKKALECLEKAAYKSYDRPLLIGRIAVGMKGINATKACELFQLALKEAKESGLSCSEAEIRAQTIHLASIDCPEEAQKVIASLKDYSEGEETIEFYLTSYGEKDSPLTLQCIKTFNQWEKGNDYQRIAFARACMGFDFEYAFEILDKIEDVKKSANEVICAAESKKYPISESIIESYLIRISKEIESNPYNDELKLMQLKLALLKGMTSEEVESWIDKFKSGAKDESSWSPRNKVLKALASFLKNDNLKRACDVALMCTDSRYILEQILTSITLDQLELAKSYISRVNDDLERVQLQLSVVSYLAKKHPETVREMLPELVKCVENIPNGKELYWEPGMGKRRDAYISYLDKKIRFMISVVQIHFDVGALQQAEELITHKLFEYKETTSRLEYKLMEAGYYQEKDPTQAEKCYCEAWAMIKQINAYDWDPDNIREKIALKIVHLNPDVALKIASEMREKTTMNRILSQFIGATAKTNRDFAKKCLEQMSEDRYAVSEKAEGYLQLIWI